MSQQNSPKVDGIENRRFFRHPTEVPVEVWQTDETEANVQQLRNVSLGGLAFRANRKWEHGEIVRIRVLINNPFEFLGKVVWCGKREDGYEVGVQFMAKNDLSKEDMVEQVCQIELLKQTLATIAEGFFDGADDSIMEP